MKSKDTCPSCEQPMSFGALSDRLAEWIASTVHGAGAKGIVLGLSGGVDSAVTAALCKKALGDRVFGVMMPCESEHSDEEDALFVAAKLGMESITVRLDRPYQALIDALPDASALARANLKPRLRMATLYFWANKLSYMVAGTGNKSELMAGYFTKYGDGGADILPLGALYKTEVRSLARELGIPDRITGKSPSAGLWSGQTDEGEMGVAYENLDRALHALESGRTDGLPADLVDRVERMRAASAHKRALPRIFEVRR